MSPQPLKWKFRQLLQREGVSVYRLHQELAKDVSRTGLYNWNQRTPKILDLKMLSLVLQGLEQITGKQYQITDILEYTGKEN